MNFLVRWIITAIGVGAAVWLIPGINTIGANSTISVFAMALVLALVNISIKPVLKVLSMPITILTLGLFYLVLNACLLELAAWAALNIFGSGIAISSFGSALLGSIVISIVSAITSSIWDKNDDKK